MSFERQTNLQMTAGSISDAPWIADLDSLIYLEGGAAINLNGTDFPEGAPSGTLVHVVGGEAKPGSGGDMYPIGLTRYDYDPARRGVGSSSTMAVVVGGVIHVDKLPVMPGLGSLPPTFVKQNDSDKPYD